MIEFRAEPDGSAGDGDQKAIESLATLARTMTFPQVTREPLLLDCGQVIEGDIQVFRQSKKTTTKTSSTTKRESRQPVKQEA